MNKYGKAALFASGLIVDTYKGFDNLWTATSVAKRGDGTVQGELSDLRSDWVRRFRKFADNYFDGDLQMAEYCLKDVFLLHKWTKIQQNLKNIDFVNQLESKKYSDIDTTGAMACHGGQCEINF